MNLGEGSRQLSAVLFSLLVVTSAFVAFVGAAGAQSSSKADIVFVFDTSGSMGPYATDLENNLDSLASQLQAEGVDAQFGLIDYEDPGPSDTFVAQDLTSDRTTIKNAIGSLNIAGGGEYASDAIQLAFDQISWRSDSKKVIVVITDEDDQSSSSTRSQALSRIQSENALLVSLSPDRSSSDELKAMAEQVNGEWANLLSTDFDDIIERIAGSISQAAGGSSSGDSDRRPEFEIGTTLINRTNVEIGEPVAINVTVENVGEREGRYTGILSADLQQIDTQRQEIEAGEFHVFRYVARFDKPDNHIIFMRTESVGRIEVTPLRPTLQTLVVADDNDSEMSIDVSDARGGNGVLIALPGTSVGADTGVDVDSVTVTTTRNTTFQLNLSQSVERPDDLSLPDGIVGQLYLDANMSLPAEEVESVVFEFTVLRDFLGRPAPENVVLYRWDGNELTELEIEQIDSNGETYTFRATSPGFSVFAAALQTPDLSLTNVGLSADSITAGDSVDVSATVRNDGPGVGALSVSLRVDGREISTRNVTVPSGETRGIEFTRVFEEAGEYDVAIGDSAAGTVTVESMATATPEPTPEPTATPDDGASTPADDGEETTTSASGPGFGVVLALVALLAAAGVLARKRAE